MPFRCAFSYEIIVVVGCASLDGLFTSCVSSRKWCLRHQWLVKWKYRQNSQLYNHQITFICAAYEIKFNKIKDGRGTSCILPWDGWQWKNIHPASTQSFTATSLYPSIASWIAISAISADIQLGWLYFGSFSFWDQKENPQKKTLGLVFLNWSDSKKVINLIKIRDFQIYTINYFLSFVEENFLRWIRILIIFIINFNTDASNWNYCKLHWPFIL